MRGVTSSSILIVEDERIVAKDIQQSLRSIGHDAFSIASSATEALSQIQERRPDLVLMDIRIKGARDGIETADIIRKQFGIPIVYLTSHADEATIERARSTNPFGYLLKPVKIAELRVAVELAAHKARAEKGERERDRWLTTTLGCIPDPLLAIDVHGKITFMNRAAEVLTSFSRADGVGFALSEVLRVGERPEQEDFAGVEPADLERLRGLRSVYVRSSSGQAREVVVVPADVVSDGVRLGTVVVLRDVTQERARARQLEEAERLDAAKTTILGLAHELNNPLAILAGNAAFAREELDLLRAEVRATSPSLDAAAAARFEHIAKLFADDQRAIARIQGAFRELRELGERPVRGPERCDVSLAFARALNATPERLRVRARIETDLAEGLHVCLDVDRLATLLRHVTTNALEALPTSGANEHVVRITSRRDADRAIVEVSDTGEGIMEAHRGRVFEPFFTTRIVGQGLGLTVGRRIAASAGGTLEIASSQRGATTMRIVVPLAPEGGPAPTPT